MKLNFISIYFSSSCSPPFSPFSPSRRGKKKAHSVSRAISIIKTSSLSFSCFRPPSSSGALLLRTVLTVLLNDSRPGIIIEFTSDRPGGEMNVRTRSGVNVMNQGWKPCGGQLSQLSRRNQHARGLKMKTHNRSGRECRTQFGGVKRKQLHFRLWCAWLRQRWVLLKPLISIAYPGFLPRKRVLAVIAPTKLLLSDWNFLESNCADWAIQMRSTALHASPARGGMYEPQARKYSSQIII